MSGRKGSRVTAARAARPRRYLMWPPTWERLHELDVELGHEVEFVEPIEGLPDMVFSANGATVVDGVVLLSLIHI